MPEEKILIIDDEKYIRFAISSIFESEKYKLYTAESGCKALEMISSENFDVIICDLMIPDINGLEILERVKQISPTSAVIMLTVHGDVKYVVSAMKLGAFDYIQKPFDNDEIRRLVKKSLEQKKLDDELNQLKTKLTITPEFPDIIYNSKSMERILETVSRIAKYNVNVLITGETGTGKEVIAKSIHNNSLRKDKDFIVVNCGAIPENLVESELFGHKKGAFTDARFDKKGMFEIADGKTIFLDEIADLPLSAQAAILRFLQNDEIRKVGDTETKKVDVRVICATNKNLEEEIKLNKFREDLYYRIKVVTLELPALRNRIEDIPPLTYHFFERFCQKLDKKIENISTEVLGSLLSYSWHGNIRELENEIERAVLIEQGEMLSLNSLSDKFKETKFKGLENQYCTYCTSLPKYLENLEKIMIEDVLKKTNRNISEAAKILGIKRTTLQDKIKRHNLHAISAENPSMPSP